MIHSIDLRIHSLLQSEQEFKRKVTARIVALALIIIVPIEAAGRSLQAAVKVSIYVIEAPFKLTSRSLKLIRDPAYTKQHFFRDNNEDFNKMFTPLTKAAFSAACIFITPLIAPFSPRAMIHLHADLELFTLPESEPETNSTKKPEASKPILNSNVKKEIDEKFLASLTSKEVKEKMQKYGLTSPHSILLYGPSMAGNKKAAEYITEKLGKNLVAVDFSDEKLRWLDNYRVRSDILYIDVKKYTAKDTKRVTDLFDRAGMPYILSAKGADAYKASVQVEVTLPDEQTRSELLHEHFDKVPRDEDLDFVKIVQATDGLKTKKIEKLAQEIKRKAFQTTSKVTTQLALEIVACAKKPKRLPTVLPPSINDFVGMEELHEKFDLYLQVLKNPEEAKDYGVKLPAGMLLYGPPGCGKTYAAKQLCEYAKTRGVQLNFQEIKGSDVASKWKGEGVKKIREAFEAAKKSAPIILFIDECEGLFPSREKLRDTLSGERTQELDESLQMIEQAKDHNVIIVGATNHISTIDSAILRTGRFDYTFEVKPPNEVTRRKMFEAKLKLKKCAPDLDLDIAAKESEGFAASDIETTINDAGLASWKMKSLITQEILMKSLEAVKGKRASVSHEPGKESGLAPIMHDLKKGLDAFKQFAGNLERIGPEAAVANDMH